MLQPLNQQVMIITGASSGIGLRTARMAAKRNAKVVLVARSEMDLLQLQDEINSSGGVALAVPADVSRAEDVHRVATTAIERFGGFDTWVNVAGVSIYAKAEEIDIEDARRLFDVNFWGEVLGSREAVKHFKERWLRTGKAGALINVGSAEGDRTLPLQGIYAASKHAVHAFTDALRMELEKENAPVSVTLIKPSSVDTPITEHAKNYMACEATLPPPVYAPEVVAEAILHAAETPEREIYAGGAGKAVSLGVAVAPGVADKVMEATMFRKQQKDQPSHQGDNLREPTRGGLRERGNYSGMVHEESLYTQAVSHPVVRGAMETAKEAMGAAERVMGVVAKQMKRAMPEGERRE